jgi:phosphate starvation-inducible PhoH-like protein
MYFKPLLLVMIVVSKISAFYPKNLYQPSSNIIMRMKKTASNDLDFDSIPSSGRKSRQKNMAPLYKPRSENQCQYVSYLNNASVPIVFGIGPAGCGKTLFACVSAIEGLRRGAFQKIVLTRPIVPVEEEELGFLPGTLVKKMDPWTRPLMDIFLEYYPQHEIDFMLGSGVIEISPLAYMRGRTFKRCFIIADEMQNSSPGQMLMLTTRIGDGSKMVITGDLKQTDRSQDNGLLDIMHKIKDYRVRKALEAGDLGIEMVEMKYSDIERSPIVSKILEIFNDKNDKNVITHDRMIPTVSPVNNTSITIVPSETALEQSQVLGKKIKINNDAALIPLSDMSTHYNGI